MIAIMIDRKLERFDDIVRYTFCFIFDTLGMQYRFINKIGELKRDEIIFFYGLLEPTNEEKMIFTYNKIVFFIKAETDLLTTGRIDKEGLLDRLQEIKLQKVIPVLSEKEFQYPLITYKVNEIYWGQFNFDIIGNVFFHLSGYEETFSTQRDIHGNIPDTELPLIGYKNFPYVNALLWMIESFLREAIITQPVTFLVKKEFWPNGEEYAYAISHNIDYLQKWSLQRLFTSFFTDIKLLFILKWGTFFRNLKEKLNYLITNYEVYWNFDEIREILKEQAIKATYFFGVSNKKQSHYDIDYSLKDPDLITEINQIQQDGGEIALLASYASHQSKEISKQITRLSNTIGHKVQGIRHNHFQYDNLVTPLLHSDLEILYDSSKTLNEQTGYRNGIAFPYRTYHPDKPINHWEIPLTFTDNILRLSKYAILSKERAQTLIKNLVTGIQKTNGLLTLNFSISKINDIKYSSQLLDFTLRLLSQSPSFSGTFSEIAEWWEARAKVEVEVGEEEIHFFCPKQLPSITITLWGNRTIKKISGAKGKIKGRSVTLKDVKAGDSFTLIAPKDDQIYLEIDEESC
ncbi:MAG: hypothetical protein K0B81_07110 [Candidatus Cloacimonetes bacterium]|nr:hypothetical protein [Candidatus Cloacimonadota bacterium]